MQASLSSSTSFPPVLGSIVLKTNERALYKNLNSVFTDSTKVIAELMQNARRAGASKIIFTFLADSSNLTIEDDGHGIQDFQDLLHTSTSGWDAKTQADEGPFGIGFLSTLYAAEKVKVESLGNECLFETEHVIDLKPVDVKASEYAGRTKITLFNVKVERDLVIRSIEKYAKGFPIPVELNGEVLARPHAIDQIQNPLETEIGTLSLMDTNLSRSNFYVQGLPIASPFNNSFNSSNVIHLNSTFQVRMPDRNELIDAHTQKARIETAFKSAWVENLHRLKNTLSPENFVKYYPQLDEMGCLDLLNEINYLPAEIVATYDDPPSLTDANTDPSELPKPLSRQQLEQHISEGKQVFYNLDSSAYEHGGQSMIIQNLIYETNSFVVVKRLDKDHWLYQSKAIDLNEASISIEFSPKTTGRFNGYEGQVNVQVTDAVTCKINDIVHQFKDPELGHYVKREGQCSYYDAEIIVASPSSARATLTQIWGYGDEYDDFNENALDDDDQALSHYIAQLLGQSATTTVRVALDEKNVGHAPRCKNAVIAVGIDHLGSITTSNLADVLKQFQMHLGVTHDEAAIQAFIGNLYFPMNYSESKRHKCDYMSFEQFLAEFEPIENKDSICWKTPDGTNRGFELVGSDFEKVSKAKPNKVWSIINDDGAICIKSGIHFVNRVAYCITKKAREKNQHINVWINQ